MTDFPYVPFYVDDYLADTHELSTLQHGCYLLLLFAAWRQPSCDLPDDDAKLARVVRQPLGTWTGKLRPVLEAYFKVEGGRWVSPRLAKVRAHVVELGEKRRQAANSRWAGRDETSRETSRDGSGSNPLTDNEAPHANAMQSQILKSKEVEVEDIPPVSANAETSPADAGEAPAPKRAKRDRSVEMARNGVEPDGFRQFWSAFGHKKGRGAARIAFAKALKKASADVITAAATKFAEAHKRAGTERQFIKHPTTWLNQECWTDEDLPEAVRPQVSSWSRGLAMAVNGVRTDFDDDDLQPGAGGNVFSAPALIGPAGPQDDRRGLRATGGPIPGGNGQARPAGREGSLRLLWDEGKEVSFAA